MGAHAKTKSYKAEMYRRRAAAMVVMTIAALAGGCTSSEVAQEAEARSDQDHTDLSADLEPFLTSYFATWSGDDMEGYRSHFLPDATIYLVKSGQIIMDMRRDPFVDVQKVARQRSGDPGVEVMTGFRAHEDRVAATVSADWELTQADEVAVGVDLFTLIRDEEWHWKIITLTYYVTGRTPTRGGRSKARKSR